MPDKLIRTRIKHKSDTLENWSKNQITLLNGELAVVDCGNDVIKFKVGNGLSAFTDLPYANDININSLSGELSSKVDKATTLSGYGISDAMISSGTIILGNNRITPLTTHQSLTNYVTKTQVNTISATLSAGIIDQTMTTIRRWSDV